MKILLGSDPELFVFEKKIPISAHGMIPGTKEAPHLVNNGAVQVDGMALEYNTNPASTLQQWEDNHTSVQQQLAGMLKRKMVLQATPTAFFSEEVFKTSPMEALELGCEPDYNAYTEDVNAKPDGSVPFRTGAGHIHIGWTKDVDISDPFHTAECIALVKYLDLYLGLPSIIMDSDYKRRELYGKAGAYRPKPYGLEYRSLSNFWVKNKDLRSWAYNNTILAIDNAMDSESYIPNTPEYYINEGDRDGASYICRSNSIPFLTNLTEGFDCEF